MTNENPYASPAAESVVGTEPTDPKCQSPTRMTRVDLTAMLIALVLALAARRYVWQDTTPLFPWDYDGLMVYPMTPTWVQFAMQAVGWAVLIRTWRYRSMPRAWEWLPLLVGVAFWAENLKTITLVALAASRGVDRASAMAQEDWSTFSLVIWGAALALTAVACLVFYIARARVTLPLIRVTWLLGVYWLILESLPYFDGGRVTWIFTLGTLIHGQVFFVLGTRSVATWTSFIVPLIAGIRPRQPRRRWTEWLGVVYLPVLFLGAGIIFLSYGGSGLAPTAQAIGFAFACSLSILYFRKQLTDLLALEDTPSPLTSPKT